VHNPNGAELTIRQGQSNAEVFRTAKAERKSRLPFSVEVMAWLAVHWGKVNIVFDAAGERWLEY
jgi:hypothetical protein